MLNKEDFLKLLEVFKSDKMKYKVQINYYFDTPNHSLIDNKFNSELKQLKFSLSVTL